mmetsp:Transcript_3746/g.6576  ORF Transcript_3746/g.6576 Transcript_3746/m.6576 type:complete len:217 (-) Transcript_3746:69-719(-)
MDALGFELADAGRGPSRVINISAAAVLCRVTSEDDRSVASLPRLVESLGCHPVMPVDNIERLTLEGFSFSNRPHQAVAHQLHLRDKIWVQLDVATVVVDAMDQLVTKLAWPRADEDVNLVASTLQSSSELRDMRSDTTDGERVQRLPGKQSYLEMRHPRDWGRNAVDGFLLTGCRNFFASGLRRRHDGIFLFSKDRHLLQRRGSAKNERKGRISLT